MRTRAARSHLFAPADNPKLLDRVFRTGADAVVFDLEDAVAPSEKAAARARLAAALERRPAGGGIPIWVRINTAAGDLWLDDVEAVVGPWLTGIRLPKAESVDDVRRVEEEIGRREQASGLDEGSVRLALTIESAAGVVRCLELAGCGRVHNLCFGNVDFLADIGARDSEDGIAALYAHSRVVLASTVAGIAPPVAPVHTRLGDDDGLRRSSERFRDLGFVGRSCIHPRQLAIVHEVFSPTAEEIAAAREVVAAYDAAVGSASGVEVTAGGQFVDIAVVRRARLVLERAASLGDGGAGEPRRLGEHGRHTDTA